MYKALDLRLVFSGDKVRPVRFLGIVFPSLGLWDLKPVICGCVPFRAEIEEAHCAVMTEEDDAESGLEPCRWCVGILTNDAIATKSSVRAQVGCAIRQCLENRSPEGAPTAMTARKLACKWLL